MKREMANGSATRDELDLRIAHCLQIAPRAAFSVIASVLGVSEQTVARRYRRMRGAGAVRVVGFIDPGPTGRQNWMLRLFCRPDASVGIGQALARRDDVQWVAVMSGGTEVDCVLRPRSSDAQDQLLLRQLPKTVQITGIEAAMVLHVYRGSTARDWRVGPDFLTAAQERLLTDGTPAVTGRTVELSARDEPLIGLLMREGRATYAELRAASDGMTEAQVRRRVTELREAGLLHFDVDMDDGFTGQTLFARVLVTVAPSHLDPVGRALGQHPDVRFCGATTGPASITVSVAFEDVDGLYRFITQDVGRLDGVAHTQVIPLDRTLKRAGAVLP